MTISRIASLVKSVSFLMLFIFPVHAAQPDKQGMIPVAKFVVQAPASGNYAPWQSKNHWAYAGEIIVISGSTFRYRRFTDVLSDKPEPDYSGSFSVFENHINLDHPNVPNPYRVAGVADGVPVLMTQKGFEQWKKTGKVSELNVLYQEKEIPPKK